MISTVIYTSQTGSCERIANEISRSLHVPAKPMGEAVRSDGKVIYVGWTLAAGVVGLKKAMEKYDVAAVVQVGMGAVTEETAAFMRQKNNIPANIAVFSKQGGFNINKLPLPFKLIMKVKNKEIAARLRQKSRLDEQEQATLNMAVTGVGEPASWDVSDIVKWAADNN